MCIAFRICQQIDLTIGLLERLTDFMFHQPLPPFQDDLRLSMNRMPQLHGCVIIEPIMRLVIPTNDLSIQPDSGCSLIIFAELPDEATSDRSNQRMIEITRLPNTKRPLLLQEVQVIDPITLSRQHSSDV